MSSAGTTHLRLRRARLWGAGVLLVGALLALLPALPLAPRPALLVSSALQALVAAATGAVVLARRRTDPVSARAWGCAGAAALLWSAGQSLLTLDRLLADGVRPAAVDLLFCGAAAAAVAAAVTSPTAPRHAAGRLRSALDAGLVVSSVLLLTWLRVGPALPDALDSVGGALALAYPVVDCLVVALLVGSVARAPREQAAALGWATGGLVVLGVTNLEASRLAQLGAPTVDATPLAAGFVLGLGLLGLGALLLQRPRPSAGDPADALPGRVQQALPLAGLPPVLLLLLVEPDALQGPGALLLALLVLLLVARQWSALTENTSLARQLVARARRYEALVHGSTDVTLVLDDAGVVRYASPSVARVLGREPGALLGLPLGDLLVPEHAEETLAALGEAGPAPLLLRLRSVAPDGAVLLLETRVSDLREDPQVGGLVLNGHDVTERRQAEVALADSERRFRRIVETAHEGIWVNDVAGVTRFANEEVGRVLGLDPAALVGRPVLEVLGRLVDRAGWSEVEERLRAGAEGRGERCTFSLTRDDGRRVHLQVSASPLFDADGAYDGSLTMLADVTERVELEERLSRDARCDALTGLANRVVLLERAASALDGDGPRPVLVYCDLDGFKTVNDTWGHAAGDAVLQEVARRLAGCVLPGQLLARLGGDEFAVLLEAPAATEDAVEALLGRLLQALHEPVPVDGRSHHVGVSIGVARALPGDDAGALLRNADLAMYRAKDDGRGRARSYEPAMHVAALTRRDLEDGLWDAAEAGELTLSYQPVVELATGRCVGAEALLRWEHPQRGPVPPDVFVPVAEETGAIVGIGRWVLRTACAEAARWHREGLPLTLSVNIAPRQLLDPGLLDDVRSALRDSGLPPAALLLEVTERSLLAGEQTRQALSDLRAAGPRLALDDFGTGWSSISHLRDHPVDVLKLDRSYVSGTTDSGRAARLVSGVLDLSRHLGTASTAEGVETVEQAETLAAAGCVYAQGFLFSRPLPAGALRTWLRDREQAPQVPAPRGTAVPQPR